MGGVRNAAARGALTGVDGGVGALGHGPATTASDRAPTAVLGQQWG
jgi:hypothetical protein